MKFLASLDKELDVPPGRGLPVAILMLVGISYFVGSLLQWVWCLVGCTIDV